MKKIILVAFMLFSFLGYSQNTERKQLFTNKYGTIEFEIINSIKDSKSDIYSIISYQNIEYRSITDTRIIILRTKSESKEFAEKLIEFSEKEKGVELSFEKEKKYSVNLFSSSNNVVIMDSEGKMTYISKKIAKKLSQDIITNIELLEN